MTDNNNNEKIVAQILEMFVDDIARNYDIMKKDLKPVLSTICAGVVGIAGIYWFCPKFWGSYSIIRDDGSFKIVFKWNTAYCIDLSNNRVIWDEPIITKKRGVILTLNHEYKYYGRFWKEYGRPHLTDEEFVGIFMIKH